MIVFSLRVTVPAERRADFLTSLSPLLESTRVEPGCLECRVHTDVEDSSVFTLVEEWASQEALNRHLLSDAHKVLVAAIELSAAQPVVRFDRVTQHSGIEVMKATRGACGRRSASSGEIGQKLISSRSVN